MTHPASNGKSVAKVLDVLKILLGHFAHGLTPGELAKATHLSPSNITRYVAALEENGFVQRIPETGRIRPSIAIAQHAIAILQSLDDAEARMKEIRARITTKPL